VAAEQAGGAGEDPRRQVPRTDAVLEDPRLAPAVRRLGREPVRTLVREVLERVRQGRLAPSAAVDAAVRAADAAVPGGLREVLNATGVIVHTNLGRAPLSSAAREAIARAGGCTDVEFDLAGGRRGPRGAGALAALAAAVPAAGAVHLTNNNAAALVLAATVLAQGREIVISRGELVEIGDGFRLPELLCATGARLREVGTTNRTHPRDYAEAVGPQTGFILKVHPSNFLTTGFVAQVPVHRLTGLGVPVVHDIGSGLLRPHPALPGEPDAASSLAAGAGLVTASGDKLLGGPQAGLLFGTGELISRLRRHPVARALRVDKLTLAALEATLNGPPSPVAVALGAQPEELRARAERAAGALRAHGLTATAVASVARVGGGGAPGAELPSAAVALDAALSVPLRTGHPAVAGRLHAGRLLLDLRTVAPDQDDALIAAVALAGAARRRAPGAGQHHG
jgi:L-seryl-tRNA(Ser) seleniumtransferase